MIYPEKYNVVLILIRKILLVMAVIVNELLAFAKFAYNQFTKNVVCSTLSSFYHEDELAAAKNELCRVVNALASPPDGWARLVNNKGGPIARKAADAAGKRAADAEDVHMMLAVLDTVQIQTPSYAAVDLRRLPPAFFAPAAPPVAPPPVNGDVLTSVVGKIEALTTTMAEFGNRLQPVVDALSRVSPVHGQQPDSAQYASVTTPASAATPHNSLANGEVSTDATATAGAGGDGEQQANSWSKLAADLTGHEAALQHRKIRVGANAGACRIKSVPRQLTCFVGRLDDSTTEEELHEYLTSVGMKGVVCKRLVPKDGRVFKTAAFRVSCCLESKDLFYNDLNWPAGAELRDWVFYTGYRNG